MTEKLEETTAAPAKFRQLTPKEWAKAEALWNSGELTAEQIGAKFGKTASTIKKHFAKKGIAHGAGAEKIRAKVEEATTKAVVEEVSLLTQRIRDTKEEHYKMSAGLAKLTWAEILKVKQDGAPMSVALNNLKSLDVAMNVLKKAREERYAVLGLDKGEDHDDDLLPQLLVQELTGEQVERLRNSQDADDLEELPVDVEEIVSDSEDD